MLLPTFNSEYYYIIPGSDWKNADETGYHFGGQSLGGE